MVKVSLFSIFSTTIKDNENKDNENEDNENKDHKDNNNNNDVQHIESYFNNILFSKSYNIIREISSDQVNQYKIASIEIIQPIVNEQQQQSINLSFKNNDTIHNEFNELTSIDEKHLFQLLQCTTIEYNLFKSINDFIRNTYHSTIDNVCYINIKFNFQLVSNDNSSSNSSSNSIDSNSYPYSSCYSSSRLSIIDKNTVSFSYRFLLPSDRNKHKKVSFNDDEQDNDDEYVIQFISDEYSNSNFNLLLNELIYFIYSNNNICKVFKKWLFNEEFIKYRSLFINSKS
jgi:hypothetical protein